MNILYLCFLLVTQIIHTSEQQSESGIFIYNKHSHRVTRDVKKISDKIVSGSTLKKLREIQNTIDLKKQRYHEFALEKQDEINNLDHSIMALQSSNLCNWSHDSLWINWKSLTEKFKEYQALSPVEKMQQVQLGQTPWHCITPELYWGMLINSASLTFYKKHGCRVEPLEWEHEQLCNLIQEQITTRNFKEKEKVVLDKYVVMYDKTLQKCCDVIEQKAIEQIIRLQSIVRKKNAQRAVQAMRQIEKTRVQAVFVHQELLQCAQAQEQKNQQEAEKQAQLQQKEQKNEKLRREEERKQAQRIIEETKKEAQRKANQDTLAAKKAKEQEQIAKQQQARQEQSARDKAKIKAAKDQKIAAEQAAKKKSDAELATLTILASLPSQLQPIHEIKTNRVQEPMQVQIEPETQKLIQQRRIAFENCGPMDESLRYEIDIYDRLNNLFTDIHAGPAQLVYLLQDLLESSSHRNAMVFDDAYEKIVALDGVLRLNSQENQLSTYLKDQKKLCDSITSRLEFLKNKSKDYPSLEELEAEMEKIIQKNKDIKLAAAITLPGLPLFGANAERKKMVDIIFADQKALKNKRNDLLSKINDIAVISRLVLLLDFINASSQSVDSLQSEIDLKAENHEKA